MCRYPQNDLLWFSLELCWIYISQQEHLNNVESSYSFTWNSCHLDHLYLLWFLIFRFYHFLHIGSCMYFIRFMFTLSISFFSFFLSMSPNDSNLTQFLCCCSVAKSCPTPCDAMDWCMPDLPVPHCLPSYSSILAMITP